MASAIHNIEGPSIIISGHGDLRDGAGAINAWFGYEIAKLRGAPTTTCYTSCWWGHTTTEYYPSLGDSLERNFYAEFNDFIRVVISWWSLADANFGSSDLKTNFNLSIARLQGGVIPGVYSNSRGNNYEMVEFLAPETGYYKILVNKAYVDGEDNNSIGIALLKMNMHQVYFPIVIK